MITFVKVNTAADISGVDFKRIFDASLPALNRNYPWSMHGLENATDREKFVHVSKYFHAAINSPHGFIWKTVKDGLELTYNQGILNKSSLGWTVQWNLWTVAPDAEGSRAYLYTREYNEASKQFWIDNDILGIRATLSDNDSDNSAHNYAVARGVTILNDVGGTFTEDDDASVTWTL